MFTMNKMIKPVSLLAIPFLLFLSSCGDEKKSQNQAGNQVLDYKTLSISPRKVVLETNYPATIEGEQDVEIRPKVDGFIERIYIDEGATVKKGQILFAINAPQYTQEVNTGQAAINIAEANVKAAQMDVDKIRPLVEKNIISKYELESAEYNLQSKKAQLSQAKATLSNASTNLSYTRITSPVNGVVGSLPFKIGSLVNSTTTLTTVSNISRVYAYFSVNEKQLLELTISSKNSMQDQLSSLPPVSLLLANNSLFDQQGKIEATGGAINSATGSIRVRATFPNPNKTVRSGSSGVVVIPLTIDDAIVIPQKVTYEIQGKRFVYLVNSDSTVSSHPISVMDNHEGNFYVVTEGLKKGDKIAMEGLSTLRDGTLIKPKEVSNIDSVYQGLNQK